MRAVDAAVCVFGVWQVFAIACVYGGVSFTVMSWLAPLVLLVGMLVWLWAAEDAPLRRTRSPLVAVTAMASAVAVLGLNRPDMDDAYYLNAAMQTVANPDLAVLSFDGMHGDVTVPIQQLIHRPQTYELLVASVMSWSGISGDFAYFVLLPAMFALLATAVTSTFLRELGVRWFGVGTLFWLVLMLAWGDGHRTFGNFGLVRLFQGKGLFLCIGVPVIVLMAKRFMDRPSAGRWLMMALAGLAAVSFTSSGLLIAPVCIGIALLAGVRDPRSLIRSGFGLLAATPVLAILGLVQRELSTQGPLISDGDVATMWSVLGASRGWWVLALLTWLPLLAFWRALPSRRWLLAYTGLAFLLVLNGQTAQPLADHVAALFSWRLYWVIPVPLLLSAAFAIAVRGAPNRFGAPAWVALVAAGGLLFSGPWVPRKGNQTRWTFAQPKRPATEDALNRKVRELTAADDLVLMPQYPASFMTHHLDAPRMVAVRHFYVKNLARHWGQQETNDRLALMRLVEKKVSAAETHRGLIQIEDRGIDLVVTCCKARDNGVLGDGLKSRGFTRVADGKYPIWTRTP
jgi:hypothetical protein